jgi:hypothetical protein
MSERRVGTRSPCADTDVANVPMVASFERAEWARFATRREYGVGLHWFLASSPRSEATGELYNPARLVRSSALTSASGRRSPPSTSKTSADSSPPSRALWASSWVISRQEGEPCNASTAPASSQIVSDAAWSSACRRKSTPRSAGCLRSIGRHYSCSKRRNSSMRAGTILARHTRTITAPAPRSPSPVVRRCLVADLHSAHSPRPRGHRTTFLTIEVLPFYDPPAGHFDKRVDPRNPLSLYREAGWSDID